LVDPFDWHCLKNNVNLSNGRFLLAIKEHRIFYLAVKNTLLSFSVLFAFFWLTLLNDAFFLLLENNVIKVQ